MKNKAAPARKPSRKPAATAPIAGEEWREMTGRGALYDPSRQEDALREARARIRDIRMRDAELILTDRSGRPIANTEVVIEQTRHAFPFGDNLWWLDAMIREGRGNSETVRAWKERFRELFNAANNLCYWTERPRNDASKTEDRQGDWRLDNFAETVAWCRSEGLIVKGHPLFWSIPKCIPEWVKHYDLPTQMKFAEVRVRNIVARFRGRMDIWDAVNEPMWEAALKNLPAREWPHMETIPNIVEYIAPVMRWCREEDPDACFVVNDYGMEQEEKPKRGSDGSLVTAASQRRRYLALMRALQDVGAAPDAIGLQSHTGDWQNHRQQWAVYDELAGAGIPLQITEFWADAPPALLALNLPADELEERIAAYIVNYLTCAFAHPAIQGFFFWGLMRTGIHWHNNQSSHDLKPSYLRVRKLIHEEWHTRVRARTDADGQIRFRGFYGDYAVRHPVGDTLRGVRFALTNQSAGPLHIAVAPR